MALFHDREVHDDKNTGLLRNDLRSQQRHMCQQGRVNPTGGGNKPPAINSNAAQNAGNVRMTEMTERIAAIALFEDRLNKMTVGEMNAALGFVNEEIADKEAWRDALIACLSLNTEVAA
ncbi:hypothetical protein [Sedimentitalea xiamensis]|uniref:hypothetical protein n=1 Tax=Sedimentitalea xiamensis TaxID=3050037 RepID=UPI002541BAEF|nr:hypothetical protein [Sedimentitalea xiamensis]